MAQIDIDKVITNKLPSMSHGSHRDAEIIEEKCPKCGSPILCVYDDLGTVDYYDNYAHICLNPECDFCNHIQFVTHSMGGRQDSTSEICHFCGRKVNLTS